jgi:hypothetical protein
MSKLAVASMFASLLGCPCVSGPFFDWLAHEQVIGLRAVKLFVLLGLVLPPALAATAHVRIRRSHRRLLGSEYVYFAYTFSAIWIAAIAWVQIALARFW